MVNQPAYLRNLKAFGRTGWLDDAEAMASAESLLAESDRGAIIMGATAIEDAIQQRLLQAMPILADDADSKKRIFGLDGALSTFSRKTLLAYALGIIDADFKNRIDLVREIRNACAHTSRPVTFSTPEIRAACDALIAVPDEALVNQEPGTLRGAFLIEIVFISHYILTGEKIDTLDGRLIHYAQIGRGA